LSCGRETTVLPLGYHRFAIWLATAGCRELGFGV
jgi:hypothetical protein